MIALLVLLCACSDAVKPDWDNYVITPQVYQLSVSQSTLDVLPVPTGSESLNINAEQTSWLITDIPAWMIVTPSDGTGNAVVQVKCTANYSEHPREAVLTVSSTVEDWPHTLSVSVTQQGNRYETVSHTVNGYELAVISVEGGTFHFDLMQTEVTQGLWKAVTGSLHDAGKSETLPVCNVSWDECQTFISRLNLMTGKTFRLPTEAEWEYAARGGNKSNGFTYSGSNTASEVAVTRNVSSTLKEVKTLQPNELGFYDMSGNAYEWCSDYYEGTQRVIRGGSFAHDDACASVTYRAGRQPETHSDNIGFRLAIDQ